MSITSSIVLYNNSSERVHNVLKSLAESSLSIQVSIIDNSPVPVSIDLNLLPNAQYIKTKKNIGFGAAHNLAIKKSLDSKAKYHLVLNPDISFSPEVIEKLYTYMETNPDVGNIMPLVCYFNGANQYLAKLLPKPADLAVRFFNYLLPSKMVEKVNRKYELRDLPLDKPAEVPALSGCFMLLRCEALRKAGVFDERFFLYFEDFDLVRRIGSYYKIIYYPGVSIKHHFERASRKNIYAFAYHAASATKYFNKWGWYRDEQRDKCNARVFLRILRSIQDEDKFEKVRTLPHASGTIIRSIALISNQAFSMLNFRGRLISDFIAKGVRVYALAPDYNEKFRDRVRSLGAEPVDYLLDRIGLNPVVDLKNLYSLAGILARLKPEAVLSNFIKPVIYGSLSARKAGINNIYSMISGLGYVYTSSPTQETLKNPFFRSVVSLLYKIALSYNSRVFFHNPDDQAEFISQGLVEMDKSVRIHGSGVDLEYFTQNKVELNRPCTFLLVARLLIEKGIREYIQAARIIKKKYPGIRFILLGGKDINPAGLKQSEIKEWVDSGVVEWPGQVDDVRPWLRECSAFVLPSWREGTPRSTLEAMATGRAVITTDVPGCRETIALEKDGEMLPGGTRTGQKVLLGKNGLLVPIRDPQALAQAMEYLHLNRDKTIEMGLQSRLMAEKYYDVNRVNEVILREMGII